MILCEIAHVNHVNHARWEHEQFCDTIAPTNITPHLDFLELIRRSHHTLIATHFFVLGGRNYQVENAVLSAIRCQPSHAQSAKFFGSCWGLHTGAGLGSVREALTG